MLTKNQILGILILVIAVPLAFLWEKSFAYSSVLDFILGVISAIGLSFLLKLMPFKKSS